MKCTTYKIAHNQLVAFSLLFVSLRPDLQPTMLVCCKMLQICRCLRPNSPPSHSALKLKMSAPVKLSSNIKAIKNENPRYVKVAEDS